MGIGGMRERMRQFRGELHLESDAAGTRVVVTVPEPPGGDLGLDR